MRPPVDLGDDHSFVLVRTHYDDPRAWRALLDALEEEYARYHCPPPDFLVVDDPAWAEAAPEEVLAALPDDGGNVEAVFLADRRALSEQDRPLLTVHVPVPGEESRPREETVFRTGLDMVYYVDANLSTGNTDVADFARGAHEAPGGVLRFASFFGADKPQYPGPGPHTFSFTPRPLTFD